MNIQNTVRRVSAGVRSGILTARNYCSGLGRQTAVQTRPMAALQGRLPIYACTSGSAPVASTATAGTYQAMLAAVKPVSADNVYDAFKIWIVDAVKETAPEKYLHPHLVVTEKWACEIMEGKGEPASLAIRLAALGHDIDRAFPDQEIHIEDFGTDHYDQYKVAHSLQTARIVAEVLGRMHAELSLVRDVARLIANHEFGGDPDSEALMDADSLSFFEENLPIYLEDRGPEKTAKKVRFMYSRMSDDSKPLARKAVEGNQALLKVFDEAIK